VERDRERTPRAREVDSVAEYRDAVETLTSAGYRAVTAAAKRDLLWEAVSRNPYATLPPTRFSMLQMVSDLLNRRELRRAFEVEDDIRPPRAKLFHPFGTVAKVRFEPEPGHPFTGLFATGGPGLARLSVALDQTNYSPSAAFKVFVDGQPSQNILLDQALERQSSGDFFERAPTNITIEPTIPPLSRIWPVVKWWLSAIAPPMHQYLDSVAARAGDGTSVLGPVAPHRVLFIAPPELREDPADRTDFREKLARIPAGTILYRMYGMTSSDDVDKTLVWTVRTESAFVASSFGDHILSLRHAWPPPGAGD
jgi:hypothetical protein